MLYGESVKNVATIKAKGARLEIPKFRHPTKTSFIDHTQLLLE